jgi:hypothetical protein
MTPGSPIIGELDGAALQHAADGQTRDAGELPSPEKEAAFFFGLFMRGHSAEQLRQDIDFPPSLMARWQRRHDPQAPSKAELQRLYDFRKRVLGIFNFLVNSETGRTM